MKKHLILSMGIALLAFSACQKETNELKTVADFKTSNSKAKSVNVVNPGPSNGVTYANGRYYANVAGVDVDFGNIYFYSGSFQDGEAVVAVDNYGTGGPYIAVPYYTLAGQSRINFDQDQARFNQAFDDYIHGRINPASNAPYQLPAMVEYIQSFYGGTAVYRGVLVRSHSVASTVTIRDATFVPVNYNNPVAVE